MMSRSGYAWGTYLRSGCLVFFGCGALVGCEDDAQNKQPGATDASANKIGVAECDEWVEKMRGCLAKMTEQERSAAEPVFKQNQEQWKKAAKDGGDIAPTCKAALESFTHNPRCQ